MSKQLLIDAKPIRLSVQESEGGKMVARGEFARCDVPTQNGRTYPKGVYLREVKKLQESVAARRAFGELDHPDDGKTKLARVSHVITKLEIDDNGVVMGEAEILNTPNGQTLKAILEAGAEVGVSSRGFGSTRALPDGSSVVGEDFTLRSFDFVADPAMKTAYPQIFAEDVEVEFGSPSIEDEFPELAEDIRAKEREAAKREAEAALEGMLSANESKIRSEMREAFERHLAESIIGVRESVAESVREEFSNDPEVAGSRAILAKIASMVSAYGGVNEDKALRDAVKSKDLEIATIKESFEKLKELARQASLALVVEQRIGAHPKAERIRKLIGDVSAYESNDELEARLDDLISEYDDFASEQRAYEESKSETTIQGLIERIDSLEEALEGAKSEIDSVSDENTKIKRKLAEAVHLAEQYRTEAEEAATLAESAQLSAYKAKRVSGLTNAPKLLQILESVDSEEAVDKIVSTQGTRDISSGDLQGLREKLKRGRSSMNEQLQESNESPNLSRDPMFGGLSTNQMLELSGVKRVR